MKRILIVTTLQLTVNSFLIPHIKFLEKNGFEVTIGSNIQGEIREELKENKWINIPFDRNPFSKNNLKSLIILDRVLKEGKFDMIHCHTPIASFLTRMIAQKNGNKNIIYTAHGLHFYSGAPLLNWLIYYPMEALAARWTDKFLTINSEDYKRVKKKFKLKKDGKVYEIPGVGLNIENYRIGNSEKVKKELLKTEIEKIFLMIGELNRNKNQIQLIEILEKLNLKGRKVRAVFVGVGDRENYLKKEVRKKGIKATFLGYRKDIPDIIAASDFLCSMSYREGLPRNIMEGMAQGKPIIATNIRGNRDLVVDGENGILIELNDVDRAVVKIVELLDNDEKYRKISKNNLEKVKQYSIETVLNKMREVYEIEKTSNS